MQLDRHAPTEGPDAGLTITDLQRMRRFSNILHMRQRFSAQTLCLAWRKDWPWMHESDIRAMTQENNNKPRQIKEQETPPDCRHCRRSWWLMGNDAKNSQSWCELGLHGSWLESALRGGHSLIWAAAAGFFGLCQNDVTTLKSVLSVMTLKWPTAPKSGRTCLTRKQRSSSPNLCSHWSPPGKHLFPNAMKPLTRLLHKCYSKLLKLHFIITISGCLKALFCACWSLLLNKRTSVFDVMINH